MTVGTNANKTKVMVIATMSSIKVKPASSGRLLA